MSGTIQAHPSRQVSLGEHDNGVDPYERPFTGDGNGSQRYAGIRSDRLERTVMAPRVQ
jgi:hypothetical protein